jgi:hypothetical protein
MTRFKGVLAGLIGMGLVVSSSLGQAQSSGEFSAGCQLISPTQGICQAPFGDLDPGDSDTVHFYGPFCAPPLMTVRVSSSYEAGSAPPDNIYAALGQVTPSGVGIVVTNTSSHTANGWVGLHWMCP